MRAWWTPRTASRSLASLPKDWQNPSVAGTSDSQGIIRIPAMMPGPFNFGMIGEEGYARWWSDACNSEWTRFQKADRFGFQRNFDGLGFDMKPGMAAVTIRAFIAATIRGRVLDPDGKPVAGATVAPALTGSGNSLTGDTRFSVETDRNGAFTMRLPASGEIAYNPVAHDGKSRSGVSGQWHLARRRSDEARRGDGERDLEPDPSRDCPRPSSERRRPTCRSGRRGSARGRGRQDGESLLRPDHHDRSRWDVRASVHPSG